MNSELIKKYFLSIFDGKSMSSKSYHASEREWKIDWSRYANIMLGKDELAQHISTADWDTVLKRMKMVMEPSSKDVKGTAQLLNNMHYPWFSDFMTDGDVDSKQAFVKSFYNYLYGSSTLRDRFTNFFDVAYSTAKKHYRTNVSPNSVISWPFMLFFPYILSPESNEFPYFRPKDINKLRSSYGSTYKHSTKPNFDSYLDAKSLFSDLMSIIKELDGKDWLDVQTLIFVLSSYQKDEASKNLTSKNKEPNLTRIPSSSRIEIESTPNLILYGPPGTGKTRMAKQIAVSYLTGEDIQDDYRLEIEVAKHQGTEKTPGSLGIVVFHPSYEYEQFIGGITVKTVDEEQAKTENNPGTNTLRYKAQDGIFLKMCDQADKDEHPENEGKAVLIIDEINRGNLPKLLGELIYALEYRGKEVTLSYQQKKIKVPEGLIVIGTMNTADRSIGLIDVAVRRRFAHVDVEPNSSIVKDLWEKNDAGLKDFGDKLANLMNKLNIKLKNHQEFGDFRIGHSYFLPVGLKENEDKDKYAQRAKIAMDWKWKTSIVPLLKEYASMGAEDLDIYIEAGSLDDAFGI